MMLLHGASNAASTLSTRLLAWIPNGGWVGVLDDQGWVTVIAFSVGALLIIAFTRSRLSYKPTTKFPTYWDTAPMTPESIA